MARQVNYWQSFREALKSIISILFVIFVAVVVVLLWVGLAFLIVNVWAWWVSVLVCVGLILIAAAILALVDG